MRGRTNIADDLSSVNPTRQQNNATSPLIVMAAARTASKTEESDKLTVIFDRCRSQLLYDSLMMFYQIMNYFNTIQEIIS